MWRTMWATRAHPGFSASFELDAIADREPQRRDGRRVARRDFEKTITVEHDGQLAAPDLLVARRELRSREAARGEDRMCKRSPVPRLEIGDQVSEPVHRNDLAEPSSRCAPRLRPGQTSNALAP